MENIRKAFYSKYSIDYLNILAIGLNETTSSPYWVSNIPNEKWRECIIVNNFDIDDPIVLATSKLEKGTGKLVFPDITGYKGFSLRGDIIGEYKNPFDICMHSNISDIKWAFCITLKGLTSILSIDYETYIQLRCDLQKIEPFLTPFYEFFKKFGSITDTPDLKNRLKSHNFDFKI